MRWTKTEQGKVNNAHVHEARVGTNIGSHPCFSVFSLLSVNCPYDTVGLGGGFVFSVEEPRLRIEVNLVLRQTEAPLGIEHRL